MKIWLQRAAHPGEVGAEETCCVCGIEEERGVVQIDALTDEGGEIGLMCVVCLDYFDRRQKESAVAHDWPSREKYVDAVHRYPEPMVSSRDELPDGANTKECDEFYEAAIIHR